MRTAMAMCAVIVMIGCGGGGDGHPAIRTSQDSVCDDVAEVACYNMYRCCSESEIEDILSVTDPRTQDECHEDVVTLCKRNLVTIDFSIKNKHLKFDAEIMNKCLEAIVAPTDTCSAISSMEPWTEACLESAWSGTVEPGGACDFPNECTKDNFCSAGRLCTALPAEGMACSIQGCASGLYCDATEVPSVCHAQLAAGGPCSSVVQCQKGLYCDTASVTPVCTARHAIGEACTGNATCESATCLPGTCADSTSTCFTDANCNGHCADDDSFCTTDSTCSSGICSGAGTLCFSQADCLTGSTCEFPVKCLPAECVGNVVCAEAHDFVSYCEGALSELPLFPGGGQLGGAQLGGAQLGGR